MKVGNRFVSVHFNKQNLMLLDLFIYYFYKEQTINILAFVAQVSSENTKVDYCQVLEVAGCFI